MLTDKSEGSTAFDIRPVRSLADARLLGSTFARAFNRDPWYRYLYLPNLPLSETGQGGTASRQDGEPTSRQRAIIQDEAVRESQSSMQSFIQDPRNHAFLVYDRASEQVAGFSAWTAPSGSRYARDISVWTRVRFNINRWLAALIPSSIVGLCERLIYGVERARARQAVRDRKRAWAVFVEDANRRFIRPEHRQQGYWHLSLLGVLPEFGRQGVAQRLLAWGMERADEEDGPIYLSASAQGLGAYQKSGFVEVGRDICYPEDPLGGWPEIVCMRERLSERAVASPEGLQSTTT